MEFEGKTALVTGACGGIGRAIVDMLVAGGAHVVALDRDGAALKALADALGDRCTPCAVDLGDAQALEAAAADVLAARGRIDILVNNAGILTDEKLAALTLDQWQRVMAVNVDAAMLLTRACAPAMRDAGWGRIVNMASYAWKSGGLTAGTAYAVSKAALVGLTRSTAREMAAEGVTVNGVAPAYVVSPMILGQLTPEALERQRAGIPVGRLCQPEEVAHTVRFLASPLAGFMTGLTIDMNGGMQFE